MKFSKLELINSNLKHVESQKSIQPQAAPLHGQLLRTFMKQYKATARTVMTIQMEPTIENVEVSATWSDSLEISSWISGISTVTSRKRKWLDTHNFLKTCKMNCEKKDYFNKASKYFQSQTEHKPRIQRNHQTYSIKQIFIMV